MSPSSAYALIASMFLGGALMAADSKGPAPAPDKPMQIEVCFVLDTTGSMGGLIEGAKAKIWSIANSIATQKPRPQLKIALLPYRDRGDEYVTKLFDLTEDIDKVFADLQSFKAGGGGDTPESVNQALDEAVEKVSWSKDKGVLKIIFLVGDCPPHMDYKDDVKYPDVCKKAVGRDLIINTVQCGGHGATTPIWQEIARSAEGSFIQLGQTGDMVAVATPHDKELADLTVAVNGTVLAYGAAAQQKDVARKLAAASTAPAEVVAARTSYMTKSGEAVAGGKPFADPEGRAYAGYFKAVGGRGDLVSDWAEKQVKLEDLRDEDLPEAIRKLTPEQRKAHIQEQLKKRQELQQKINEVTKKRDEYVAAERTRLAKERKADAFDEKVSDIVTEQAKRKK